MPECRIANNPRNSVCGCPLHRRPPASVVNAREREAEKNRMRNAFLADNAERAKCIMDMMKF